MHKRFSSSRRISVMVWTTARDLRTSSRYNEQMNDTLADGQSTAQRTEHIRYAPTITARGRKRWSGCCLTREWRTPPTLHITAEANRTRQKSIHIFTHMCTEKYQITVCSRIRLPHDLSSSHFFRNRTFLYLHFGQQSPSSTTPSNLTTVSTGHLRYWV